MRWFHLVGVPLVAWLAIAASAQDSLEKLERAIEEEAKAAPAEPERAEPRASAPRPPGYLGLIADESSGEVRVELVREGTAAQKAGILVGDIVSEINGRPVTSLDAMGELLAPLSAGERVAFRLRRGDALLVTNVVLGARHVAKPPAEPEEAEPAPVPVDALDALKELDRLVEIPPPDDPEPKITAPKPKAPPERIEAMEGELRAVRARIVELERELAELRAGKK